MPQSNDMLMSRQLSIVSCILSIALCSCCTMNVMASSVEWLALNPNEIRLCLHTYFRIAEFKVFPSPC